MFQVRITSGPQAGRVLALDSQYSYAIGRGADAHLSLPEDHTLSRTHAELVPQGDGWILRNKSQHGSLVGGAVIQGDQAMNPGDAFQLGETHFAFEAAGAAPAAGGAAAGGAAAGGAAAGGAPAGGAPAGGAAAGGAAAGGAAAGAAAGGAAAGAAAAGAAAGAANALQAMAAGPFELPGELKSFTGEGFPFVPLIKGGFAIWKANMIPAALLGVPMLLSGLMTPLSWVLPMSVFGIVATVVGLISLVFMLASLVMIPNYIHGVKEFVRNGTPITIGSLFSFDDIVNRVLTMIIQGVACMCCGAGMLLMPFALCLQVEKSGTPFVSALKGALAWTTKNLVPRVIQVLLLLIVLGIVNVIGMIPAGLGAPITIPTVMAALWLAFDLKRDEVVAAAAEKQITL